ncbi:hypothetical protein [Shinella sp.]|uniref:hypothetical protein n=1 Tax=Shinella sp. TaxID=1870904 RepID=UPI0029BB700B|nr:hypothetical protein [Shinella sp.]MDX3973252.1 hypothetical protein [Shinella sp.]
MTDSKIFEDGGPAAPCSNEQFTHGNPSVGEAWSGMSLRDWFAGQAMNGAWSQPNEAVHIEPGQTLDDAIYAHWLEVAKAAYIAADAMIAARKGGA